MADDALTDEELVRKILSGDALPFRILVRRHQDILFSIGMRVLRNEEDALDSAQESFIRAYQSLATFKGRSLFKYWLYRIAYNCAISKVRGKGVTESVLVDEVVESRDKALSYGVESDEIKGILMQAVQKLPEQYRICVDFFFFGGMSYPEIHSVTGIPVNTIKSNVFRAKQLLRDELKGTIAEEYHEL